MIPLVGEVKELKFVKDVVVKVADELIAAAGVDMKYQVGTMIEIPRAALTAGEIAAMQTRAVIKAALNVSAETGHVITPHIMIPLVGEVMMCGVITWSSSQINSSAVNL